MTMIPFSGLQRRFRLYRLLALSLVCSTVFFIVIAMARPRPRPVSVTAVTVPVSPPPASLNILIKTQDPDDPKVILLGADSDRSHSQVAGNRRLNVTSFEQSVEGVQTCRIPKLDINGSEVIRFFKNPPPLKCNRQEENWVFIDKNRLFRINPNAEKSHGQILCRIRHFDRINDADVKLGPEITVKDGDLIGDSDYLIVKCNGTDQHLWKHLLWTAVPNASRIDELSKKKRPDNWSGLDVYFIGYDSLSQMSFRRKLPKTVRFVEDVLDAVVLNGYNIVGDGTPQAFIPILTGSTEEELPLTRKRYLEARYVDEVYPFVWKNFSDAGYITFYGEDAAAVGTFTYRLKGFKEQPTDLFTRTFFQLAEKQFKDMKCFGSIPMHKEWFRLVGEFMHRYNGLAPRFLIAFHSLLSHDNINLVQVADEDTAAHLKEMHESGELNNSLVIVMADHGHRFAQFRSTHQGQLEERLPFFAISLPKQFRETEKGRIAYENLKANKDRLSTPFDIHATLLDILNWPNKELLQKPNDLKERSMSLFRPIPLTRTCTAAGIEPHWCTCLNWESAMEDPKQKNISEMLARTVVKTLNSHTEPERKLCAPLELKSLESSRRLVPHADLLKYKTVKDADGFVPDLSGTTGASFALYQLKFVTIPGGALYEATVNYNLLSNEATVDMTAISHVNKYGDLPHCIIDKNYFMAAYCVCYDKI